MTLKVIRTEEQYQAYLEEVQRLLAESPEVGSPGSERLELLTVLLEAYENTKYAVEAPDPIDAIKFRMEEKSLKQADLAPYFGTPSRVSEVLNRKRPLTVQMIRALSVGLGISADTLVGISTPDKSSHRDFVDWKKFPLKEIMRRGWIPNTNNHPKKSDELLVKEFILNAGLQFGAAEFKRTICGEAESPTTKYSLYCWLARVIQKTREKKSRLGIFDSKVLGKDFMRELARLSWSEFGPLLAIEFLENHGISIVIESHLKGTLLDGAALRDIDGTPIIGLTLRYDRLDNFWFTLMHEVAHLWKHVGNQLTFLDDLDASSEDRREAEANRLAKEAFVPRSIWKRSDAYLRPSKETIDELSRDLKIHPSILAGRIRRDTGNYNVFSDMIGQNEVSRILSTKFVTEEV